MLRVRLISKIILNITKPYFLETETSILRHLLPEAIRAKSALQALGNLLTDNETAVKADSV